MSIAENIFLGNEYVKSGVIDWVETNRKARELLAHVGLNDEPQTAIKNIGVGKQQLVEIAKALSKDVRLLILDEPTAALNEDDSQHLLGLIDELRRKGITCIIISHKLNEIEQIADSITIIRDGQSVETLDVKGDKVDEDRIIRGMVGREMSSRFPDYTPNVGETFVEVRNWTVESPVIPGRLVCKGSNFYVRRGEIVGFAGLMGAGRTELVSTIFGDRKADSGEIYLNGEKVDVRHPRDAIRKRIGYLPEERGLYKDLKLEPTLIYLATLKGLDEATARQRLEDWLKRFDLYDHRQKKIQELSKGMQQKAQLIATLLHDPDLIIVDEPFAGLDPVNTRLVKEIIEEQRRAGKAIIMSTHQMHQVEALCSRIVLINNGEAVLYGEVDQIRRQFAGNAVRRCGLRNGVQSE